MCCNKEEKPQTVAKNQDLRMPVIVTHEALVVTTKEHTAVTPSHYPEDLPFLPFTGWPWAFSSHSAASGDRWRLMK